MISVTVDPLFFAQVTIGAHHYPLNALPLFVPEVLYPAVRWDCFFAENDRLRRIG
jgi:hypothetical protein